MCYHNNNKLFFAPRSKIVENNIFTIHILYSKKIINEDRTLRVLSNDLKKKKIPENSKNILSTIIIYFDIIKYLLKHNNSTILN